MPELTSAERRALRARAHLLDAVVLIGDQGLTPDVLAEAERALEAHELIKIRVAGAEREEREAMLSTVCELKGAAPVQHIGKILVIYRQNPEKARKPQAVRMPSGSGAKKAGATSAKPRNRTTAKPSDAARTASPSGPGRTSGRPRAAPAAKRRGPARRARPTKR
jgi:RNA-binding protein